MALTNIPASQVREGDEISIDNVLYEVVEVTQPTPPAVVVTMQLRHRGFFACGVESIQTINI